MAIVSTYPVNLTYNYGSNVSTVRNGFSTSDGIFYSISPLLSGAKDVTFNQNSLNVLSNNLVLSDCLSSTPLLDGTNYITTSVLSLGSYYLSAGTNGGSKIAFITDASKATLFTLTFVASANTVAVSYNNLCIAFVSGLTNLDYCLRMSATPYAFNYNFYKNSISLFVKGGTQAGWVACNINNTYLETEQFIGFDTNTNILTLNRFSEVNYKLTGDSSNVKYVNIPNSIDISVATTRLPYNYLITAPYENIAPVTDELDYNITPLKNYYSPEYIQTPTLSAQSRKYNKLFTGLNSEEGYDKIYLSYLGNQAAQTFYKDKDTYFHYPVSAVNIALSASTLAKSGAVPGSSPWRSDRLFVKQADYRKYTPWGNYANALSSQPGTLFCSWLSASDIGLEPVWMDRYFDPNKTGPSTVLTSVGASPSNNNYPNIIWDTPTTQVFCPESLYVYHKIGDSDNMLVVNNLSGTLTHQITNWTNPLVDNVTGLSAGYVYSLASNSVQTYASTRDQALNTSVSYAKLNLTDNDLYTPGFTLAFQAYNNDWNNFRGDQIIGNFYNGGFGLFKYNPLITPFITLVGNGTKIQTLNNQLSSLYTTTDAPGGSSIILKGNYNESFFIITASRDVSEYDQDGTCLKTFHLYNGSNQELPGVVLNAYLIYENNIRKLFVFTYSGNSIYQYKFDTSGNFLYGTSTAGYTNCALDLQAVPHFFNSVGNGTVDNNNVVFALSGEKLVRNLNTSNPQFILSAYKAEYIACDHQNNIWLLYANNNLCKLDNYGRLIWDISLTSDQIFTNTASRIINFSAELDPNSNSVLLYAIVVDGKTQNVFKVEPLSGNIVAKYKATTATFGTLSSTPLYISQTGDVTGYDYQRKYNYINNNDTSLLTVKANINNVSTLQRDNQVYQLNYDSSVLMPGWHHFAITVDPYNMLNFYVDGSLATSTSIGDLSAGIYRVYNERNNIDLVMGTSSFKSQTLYEYTKQTIDPYSFNGSIADVRFYSQALERSDIVALQRRFTVNSFSDLTWAAPAGTRYYIEQIDRFFPHRLPGAKSHLYNIKIKNSNITDPGIRSIIEKNILSSLSKTTPIYTQLNQIIWQ